jgi:uncharacterized membrane protein YcfT
MGVTPRLGESAQQRIEWVDTAKGIAIIGVVLYHAVLFLNSVGIAGRWEVVTAALDTLRMPLFFLASGLFAQKILHQSFSQLARKRLLLFIYLYVLWSAVRLAVFQFGTWTLHGDAGDWREFVLAFVWPSGGLWFLYGLTIYSILVWATRKLPVAAVLAGSALVSLVFTCDLVNTGNVGWDKIGSYIFWFMLAVHVGPAINAAVISARRWQLAAVLAIYIAALVLVSAFELPGERFTNAPVSILAVSAGVGLSYTLSKWKAAGFLHRLGRVTLPVYLVHYFPIALFAGWIFTNDAVRASIAPLNPVMPLLLSAAAIAISLLVWWLLRRIPGIYTLPVDLETRKLTRTPQ